MNIEEITKQVREVANKVSEELKDVIKQHGTIIVLILLIVYVWKKKG